MIITFYSWKGGVGRTMALANTAVQLTRKGNRVLMIDWDLEAPGLMNYFTGSVARQANGVQIASAKYERGLLGLLSDALAGRDADASAWKEALMPIAIPPNSPSYRNPSPPTPGRLDLLPSGYGIETYAEDLAEFSWTRFFAERNGGTWLESLRNQCMAAYEFVLIDSRTGLTDSGGVCTIQMPDALVLVFTANEQSLDDGLKIVAAAQKGRQSFAFERAPLTVAPLLSRWEGEKEVDLGEEWMARFDIELKEIVASWLPRDFSPRDFLRKLRVPHVARFSFGEPLPVVTHTLEDATLPGLAYESLAQLLHAQFANAGELIDPNYRGRPQRLAGTPGEDEAALVSLVSDPVALSREIAQQARLYGARSSDMAIFLRRAGKTLAKMSRHAEAEPLLRRAVATAESARGPNDPEVAVDLANLADLLQDANRLTEAEPLMRRALAINEQSYGPDHPNVATNLSNLATLFHDANRLAEAEPLMRRALAIDEQSYGPDHPNVAIRLNNLAALLMATNRLAEAEPLMRRALAIDEKSYGPDHPSVARDLNNLAQLFHDANRLTEAEPLMRRALSIDEQSYGPDHTDVATDLNNLAQLLQDGNRLAEAEPLMRRALAIDEQSYGPDHTDVATDLNNLAQLLKDGNRLAEAEPLMRRALAILETSLGPDHPRTVTARNNLTAVEVTLGRGA